MFGPLLIDTSVLLRALQPDHAQHITAARALLNLPRAGRNLNIVPQNLFELWVVATRPKEQNGLGMNPFAVHAEICLYRDTFLFLPDTAAVCDVWESLVLRYNVIGKPAHDARLVAAMQVHGISSILTFDRTGFSRFPGIEAVHPADVALSL